MGELRLTCPECGTEYRLAEGAIPPAGRNVECSSCGHVWLQAGQMPAAPPAAPQENEPQQAPRLNRPLPSSVLSVLQEEAALSRQQRSGAAAPAPPPPSPAANPAETWPATTVTDPPSVGVRATLPLASDPPQAGPAPSRRINARPDRPTESVPARQELEETVTRTTPHRADRSAPQTAAAPASDADTSAYRRGMLWSAGIAAALLLVYLAAPYLADQGGFGANIMEWRLSVDDGRSWLHQQIFGSGTGAD